MEQIKDTSTEAQILQVAERLFMERGYALTSTVDIAKEVGCNQALVHYYYRSKEKLFQKVFDEKSKLFIQALLSPAPEGLTLEEILRQRIELHFNIIQQSPNLPFLVVNELLTNPNRINILKQNLYRISVDAFGALQAILDKEYAAGKIRKVDARQLIINVVSLNVFTFLSLPIASEIFNLHNNQTQQTYLKERKEEIIKTILNGIKA
ncbi:MAG: TetR/AcrR family transcriptional regulator [Bacteroidales bacterium]